MDDLIERAKQGESRAFVALFEHHKPSLWKTALAVLGDDNDASDAMQETALRAWRAIPTFKGRSGLGTWLTRIMLRVCFDMLRVRKREVPHSSCVDTEVSFDRRSGRNSCIDESTTLIGQSASVDYDEAIDVKKAMHALSPNDRMLLTLFYLNDYPVKRIASVFGVSEGAVKTRLTRARERFRKQYKDEPQDGIEVG